MNLNRPLSLARVAFILALALSLPNVATAKGSKKPKKDESVELRAAYIKKVQQAPLGQNGERTMGSLWSPSAPLADIASDFKAARLNDTIIIQVIESTTATTTGTSAQGRTVALNSTVGTVGGVSGPGALLDGSSSQTLKGAGSVAANSALTTSLTGQVISVLPNGNLIVEAERLTSINGQRDTMIVRGVVRPGDISNGNQVLSTQLMNLEVEMKGKGLVADGTRGPNVITRTLMKWLGM